MLDNTPQGAQNPLPNGATGAANNANYSQADPQAPTMPYRAGAAATPAQGQTQPARPAQPAAQGQPQAAQAAGAAGAAGAAPAAQAQKPIEVPERPKLADDIQLKGEMVESAFKEPPWLLERNGGYIQVPKLLYHVAEQCDGQQTLEEIARKVSEKLSRNVTPDNIRTLVAKLIPMGIVDVPGMPKVQSQRGSGVPGALSVNAKMLRIGPRFIKPVSKILQFFYIKPVLLLCLLVAFAAEGWMFLVHGIGDGLHDALYTPGLMLAVLGVIVVATAFHEFGHASALERGGGSVGEMGAGIYIVYPAFYTDVTDNYRLSRWARVRTDLGGIYFNLIFSVLMMVLYILTGATFLLAVVLFVNFEIIHNLLPFVRLDGYWTLADITGIPDFFSLIAPYCRTYSPFRLIPWPKGKTCPELRNWARWVFFLYIIITVPLLAFLLFMMIRGVPRVLATFWDAFWKQTSDFGNALNRGDILGLVATVAQMLLLALPTFALAFTLFNLAKRIGVGLWNWGRKSARNGVVAALTSVAAVLLLLFLWSPGLITGLFGLRLPTAGPLQNIVQFKPIAAHERFAVGDIVSGQVITRTRDADLPLFGLFGSSSPITATVTPTTTVVVETATPEITGTVATRTPGTTQNVTAISGTPSVISATATITGVTGIATATSIPSTTQTGVATVAPIASTSPIATGTTPPANPATAPPTGTAAPGSTQSVATTAPLSTAQATTAPTTVATTVSASPTGATQQATAAPTSGSTQPTTAPTLIPVSTTAPTTPPTTAPLATTAPTQPPATTTPAPPTATTAPIVPDTPAPPTPTTASQNVQPTTQPVATSTPTHTPTSTPTSTSLPTTAPAAQTPIQPDNTPAATSPAVNQTAEPAASPTLATTP